MNNATKFTPGPWKFQGAPKHQHAIDRKFEVVADCDGGQMVVVGEHSGIDCLTEANARLIASAPTLHAENENLRAVNADLIATLQNIFTALELSQDRPILLAIVGAAIARATGGGK